MNFGTSSLIVVQKLKNKIKIHLQWVKIDIAVKDGNETKLRVKEWEESKRKKRQNIEELRIKIYDRKIICVCVYMWISFGKVLFEVIQWKLLKNFLNKSKITNNQSWTRKEIYKKKNNFKIQGKRNYELNRDTKRKEKGQKKLNKKLNA